MITKRLAQIQMKDQPVRVEIGIRILEVKLKGRPC